MKLFGFLRLNCLSYSIKLKELESLNKALSSFSSILISDWEKKDEEKTIEIEARSTQVAKELIDFFVRSYLPIRIKK